MITILTGENSFEVEGALTLLSADFDGQPERVDGSILETRQLPDLLMGTTLFATKRLLIIKNLSQNKAVWMDFSDWIPRISEDISVVIVDPKIDKRTKTFKDLQKAATIREFKPWTERDTNLAEKWVVTESTKLGALLTPPLARFLVARVGIDQWALWHALEKLALVDTISTDSIENLIEPNPIENVFNLFEAALAGNVEKVHTMIRTLELTEDPYRLFGLMSGQAFQLAALAMSDKSSAEVAKDLGAHPFAVSKLVKYADRLGLIGVRRVITAFAEADGAMKTSATEPWLLIERALIRTAQQI